MKQQIKKNLAKLLHPLIIRLGYKVNDGDFNFLENFFQVLKNLNFRPEHIVDIGANHGSWTRIALKYFPEASYTLLEPQSWLSVHFNDILDGNPKIKFFPVGAGSAGGSFQFTVAARDDSSTFRFNEQIAKEYGLRQIEVEVVTLNELIPKERLLIPDIIKIDAEGMDLQVLKGSDDFFGKTEIFMVEASMIDKSFENDIGTLIRFMDEKGYIVFDITDLNRLYNMKVLWLIEIAFIKKDGFVDRNRGARN